MLIFCELARFAILVVFQVQNAFEKARITPMPEKAKPEPHSETLVLLRTVLANVRIVPLICNSIAREKQLKICDVRMGNNDIKAVDDL